MPKYITQSFTYDKGDTVFYAVQNEHNHDKGNEFSKAAIDWLVKNASWPRAEIRPGHWAKEQSKPAAGKELSWNAAGKKWVKV